MRPAPGRRLARAAGAAASQAGCELLASGPLASPPPASPPPPAALLSPRPQPQRHARANEHGSSISSSSSREAAAESHFPTPSSLSQKREHSLSIDIFLFLSSPSPLHTRLHFLTSFFLLPNPSLCPSTCLPLPPGRATALRTSGAATVCLLQPGEPSGARGVQATRLTSNAVGAGTAPSCAAGQPNAESILPNCPYSGGVECRVRQGTVRCSALTQVTVSRHKTLLRQWRRLIGRCAAGYASCAAEPR